MLTLDAAIGSIETVLNDQFVQDWYEEGVPTYETIHYTGGQLVPYIIVQYGDLIQGFDRAMSGTRGDAHDFPVRFMAVAPDAKTARKIRNKIIDKFTGFMPAYSAELKKRGGGGAFAVIDDSGAAVAYISPAMFRTSMTLFEVV